MNSVISKKEAIDRLIIGLFILLFDTVWLLHQAGLLQETAWIWPFALVYFGTLIAVGAVFRLRH